MGNNFFNREVRNPCVDAPPNRQWCKWYSTILMLCSMAYFLAFCYSILCLFDPCYNDNGCKLYAKYTSYYSWLCSSWLTIKMILSASTISTSEFFGGNEDLRSILNGWNPPNSRVNGVNGRLMTGQKPSLESVSTKNWLDLNLDKFSVQSNQVYSHSKSSNYKFNSSILRFKNAEYFRNSLVDLITCAILIFFFIPI